MSSEYDDLDRDLRTVFALMEGMADVEEAFLKLRDYLDSPRPCTDKPDLDVFLIELFFDKCRKDFSSED